MDVGARSWADAFGRSTDGRRRRRVGVAALLAVLLAALVAVPNAGAAGPATCPRYVLWPAGAATDPFRFVWADGQEAATQHGITSPDLAKQVWKAPSGVVISDWLNANPQTAVPRKPDGFFRWGSELAPFAPDGSLVPITAYVNGKRELHLVDPDTLADRVFPGYGLLYDSNTWSPDAKHLVVRSDRYALMNLTVDPPQFTPLPASLTRILGWSPDGTWLALAESPGATGLVIHLIRRDGAVERTLPGMPVTDYYEIRWAWRPGTNEFAVLDGTSLRLTDAPTGVTTTIDLPGKAATLGPVFTADGSTVGWSDGPSVHRLELASGTTQTVTPTGPLGEPYRVGPPAFSPDGSKMGVALSPYWEDPVRRWQLDAAVLDSSGVARLETGIDGPYYSPNGPGDFGFPEPGSWSPDGTTFAVAARLSFPVVNPMSQNIPVSALLDDGPVDASHHLLTWLTCTASATPVVPIDGDLGTTTTTSTTTTSTSTTTTTEPTTTTSSTTTSSSTSSTTTSSTTSSTATSSTSSTSTLSPSTLIEDANANANAGGQNGSSTSAPTTGSGASSTSTSAAAVSAAPTYTG